MSFKSLTRVVMIVAGVMQLMLIASELNFLFTHDLGPSGPLQVQFFGSNTDNNVGLIIGLALSLAMAAAIWTRDYVAIVAVSATAFVIWSLFANVMPTGESMWWGFPIFGFVLIIFGKLDERYDWLSIPTPA